MQRCPVAAFRKMISGKYKLRLLWALQNGPRRYGELKSGLLRGTEETKEIAPRVLRRSRPVGLLRAGISASCRRKWNIG